MPRSALTTTLSTKGQVILPASIRRARAWGAGTRLEIEDTPDGVLLKAAPLFPRTEPGEVFGCLPHAGPPVSLEDMDLAVAARRRGDGMLAIDTNVVVRYLTGDDPGQSLKARRVVDGEAVFVPTTVLLETEWVLRGAYGYRGARLAAALTAFAGLPTVSLEAPSLAVAALDALARGLDFADALHLGGAKDCDAFVTFDRALAKAADSLGGVPIRAP